MKVYTIAVGNMSNRSYIVENDGSGILIDPSWDIDKIEKILKDYKIDPVCVIFTHGHYDHTTDAQHFLKKHKIRAYLQLGDLVVSGMEPEMLNVIDGDRTEVIASLEVNFMYTPGHSKGSMCIKIGDIIFTGDTLFPGAIGRTDLPGSDGAQMLKSLKRLANLPPKTVIYSGHGYGGGGGCTSTIGEELKNNPFLDFRANAGLINDIFNAEEQKITFRKGEYYLLDETEKHLVSHTIFPLPNEFGKGVLVTPTVDGNILLGPTAMDVENPIADVTYGGLNFIKSEAGKIVDNITSPGALRLR